MDIKDLINNPPEFHITEVENPNNQRNKIIKNLENIDKKFEQQSEKIDTERNERKKIWQSDFMYQYHCINYRSFRFFT